MSVFLISKWRIWGIISAHEGFILQISVTNKDGMQESIKHNDSNQNSSCKGGSNVLIF